MPCLLGLRLANITCECNLGRHLTDHQGVVVDRQGAVVARQGTITDR
jgi:hypothetical protein